MILFALPVLVAVLGQPGDDPEKIYRAMEAKITKADTLQAKFQGLVESGSGGGGGPGPNTTFKGKMTVGDGNKAHMDIAAQFGGKASNLVVVADGTKVLTTADGASIPFQISATTMRSLMNVSLTRTGVLPPLFMASANAEGKDANPLDTYKVSNFKKVKTTNLGGRDAVVIQYEMTIPNMAPVHCTVWVEIATLLPIKRVLLMPFFGTEQRFTEIYGDYTFNTKADPKLFVIP
jgi:hypothetical protein